MNITTKVASFRRDRRGAAAVEFALIAPILLAMYFVTMEVSQAIETSKKVSRMASTVADLVTQIGGNGDSGEPGEEDSPVEVASADIDAIMELGEIALQPYNRSTPTITVTGIEISGAGSATVAWSRKIVGGVSSPGIDEGTSISVPAGQIGSGTFVVRVSSGLAYRPMITWAADNKKALGLTAAFDGIQMGETNYAVPRSNKPIECTGCYSGS